MNILHMFGAILIVIPGCVIPSSRCFSTGRQTTITNTLDAAGGFEKYSLALDAGKLSVRSQTQISRTIPLPAYTLMIEADGRDLVLPNGKAQIIQGASYAVFALLPAVVEFVEFPISPKQLKQLTKAKRIVIRGYGGDDRLKPIELSDYDRRQIIDFCRQHGIIGPPG